MKFSTVSGTNPPLNNTGTSTIYNPQTTGLYELDFDYNVTNVSSTVIRLSIQVNGIEQAYVDAVGTGNGTINLNANALDDVTIVAIGSGAINFLNVKFELVKVDYPFTEGVIYKVSSLLNNVTFAEYLQGFVKLFGLISYTDNKTKTIILEPSFDVYIETTNETINGFYKGHRYAKDWSDKLIQGHSTSFKDLNSDRYQKFVFKKDSNDKSIDKQTDLYSYTVDYEKGNEETKTTSNPLFAATKIDQTQPLFKFVPHLLKESDVMSSESPDYDFEMRILYKMGNVGFFFDWYNDGNVLQKMPIAYQVNSNFSPYPNLGFGDVLNTVGSTYKGIVSTFMQKRIDTIKKGFKRSFRLLLEQCDIENLEGLYREPIYLQSKHENGYYYIEVVNRFDLNSKKSICDVVVFNDVN